MRLVVERGAENALYQEDINLFRLERSMTKMGTSSWNREVN
jgi:hypothetical protein